MVVTELGMETSVKPKHSLNAASPIVITELGMVTEVKSWQPKNAFWPIDVTKYAVPP